MKPGVGAVALVIKDGCVLLVERGNEPAKGKWSLPGGSIDLGETGLEAAVRELREETGVIAKPLGYLTNSDVIGRDADGRITYQFLLAVVTCAYESGTPVAADDAADARWVPIADLPKYDTTDDLAGILDLASSPPRQ